MHRSLKVAITCRGSDDWYSELPIVLLGLRTAHKADLQSSAAELLHGTQLRLPGDFFMETSKPYTTEFAERLKENMRALKPSSTAHHTSNQRIYKHKNLRQTSHVFVRNDFVKPPLTPAYSGPHPVTKRFEKYFIIEINGRSSKISVDRLRPAHILTDEEPAISTPIITTTMTPDEQHEPVKVTRSGRRVRLPDRYRPG